MSDQEKIKSLKGWIVFLTVIVVIELAAFWTMAFLHDEASKLSSIAATCTVRIK